MILTGRQRRHLRALGHHRPVALQFGKEGVSDAAVAALDLALGHHELVKLKLGPSFEGERGEAAEELARRTSSAVVQVLGRTVLLYRRHPEEPRIELPA
ncbi:YhbY family RNA-binding protein [Myxococcota bacterium]|nr:YhbY family RNA-binding protein [Myxococcota bacterium]